MLELLSQIIEAANDLFMEHQSLGLLPSEYLDGCPAPADITEIEIEIDRFYADMSTPGLWITITTQQHNGWCGYLQSDYRNKLEGIMLVTLEGYCFPGCNCPMCDVMRNQSVVQP